MDDSPKHSKKISYFQSAVRARLSADIIREARDSLTHPQLRCLSTRRPETPRDEQRRLFRQSSVNDLISRPPSTFSMGPQNFDAESRPCSGTRLSPLDHKARGSAVMADGALLADLRMTPRPPPHDSSRSGGRRANSRSRPPAGPTFSPAPIDPNTAERLRHRAAMLRSESLNDVSDFSVVSSSRRPDSPPDTARRVHSGPTTRAPVGDSSSRRPDSPPDTARRVHSGPTTRAPIGGSSSRRPDSPPDTARRVRSGPTTRAPAPLSDPSASHHSQHHQHHHRQTSLTSKSSAFNGSPHSVQSRTRSDSEDQRYGAENVCSSDGDTVSRGSSSSSAGRQASRGLSLRVAELSEDEPMERREVEEAGSEIGCNLRSNRANQSQSRDHSKQRKPVVKKEERQGGEGDGRSLEDYYQCNILPILDKMTVANTEKNVDRLLGLTERLYLALEKEQLLGKNCQHRHVILKTVYKLLSHENPHLMVKLARLILALKVSSNNLMNVCKLIYQVSRDNKNDQYFLEDNLLALLVETACTIDQNSLCAALLYCLSSVKFLSNNQSVLKQLSTRQHLSSFSQLLVSFKPQADTECLTKEQMEVLQQLTALLRNVADVSGTRHYFLELNILEELSSLLPLALSDSELLLNISRILSKLTVHADCCKSLTENQTCFQSFILTLQKHREREDLVLRVSFVLGNLTAKLQDARRLLFDVDKALETLIVTLRFYCEKDLLLDNSRPADTKANRDLVQKHKLKRKKLDDILIKIVRVIANLAISEEIGQIIASSDDCVDLLMKILERKSLQCNEEIVLNSMATINNLSYYNIETSSVTRRRFDIAKLALKFFEVTRPECLLEATRVFGNLSRERNVRDFLVRNKVDEAMVALLDSENTELIYTACGVLINLTTDDDKRLALRQHGGISKLIDVLRDVGRSDWQLASMTCQTLWNYSTNVSATSSNACFGEDCAQQLSELLLEYLEDEGEADDSGLGEMAEYNRSAWKNDFYPVANDLLARIESNQSQFEPLIPSDSPRG